MNRRIKILYTIPNFDTAGSGKVVYDLVKHIDKAKFEPHICCSRDNGDFFRKIQNLNVPIHIVEFTAKYRPIFKLPLRIWKISQFFKKHNFDIIHSWHWSSDFTEPIAARLAGIPFVYTKKAMGWGNKAWLWRSRLSNAIITINNDMELQFFSQMKEKVHPIHIGLQVKDFRILKKTYITEDGYSVERDDFVIVSIANLVAVKGIELLLEAVEIINSPRIKVFVVGDDTSKYAQSIKRKYASSRIKFTGKKQNIKSYLALADLFVIPTKNEGRKEGQPIAPIEAMLSGRIVLGSDISGIKDVLQIFDDCLFKAGNASSLVEKILYIMNLDNENRELKGKQMHDFAKKQYNIKESIGQHELLYQELIYF